MLVKLNSTNYLIIILIISFCSSIKAADPKTFELLTGFWIVKESFNYDKFIEEYYSFYENNEFSIDVIEKSNNDKKEYSIYGKFKINDGFLYYDVTRSTNKDIPAGSKDWNKILFINSVIVVTEGSDGEVVVAKRIGDPSDISDPEYIIKLK
ncbi:MAG: hypothetical protein RIB78_11780 [Gammaproteobacteria bacterium]